MNSQGQSLLEVVITVSIAVTIVVALTASMLKGLQSSSVAQNQSQATKLAQEALERVRSFRDNNVAVDISGTLFGWNVETPSVWDSSFPSLGEYRLSGCPGASCKLLSIAMGSDGEALVNGTFTRKLKIENDGSNTKKKVTAIVTWKDYAGVHNSDTVTILTRHQF